MNKRNAGFTLIEIMLVMVLLSMSAVAVIMTLPANKQDVVKQHAQRFFYKLQLLNEDAILNGKDFGITIRENRNQYIFVVLTKEGWQRLDSKNYQPVELDEGLEIRFEPGSGAWADDDRLFEPGSLFDDEMFADEEENKQVDPPQVFVLSSGEVTPFSLDFYVKSEEETRWQVLVQENGEIQLRSPLDLADGEAE